jgi:hypothetical protein
MQIILYLIIEVTRIALIGRNNEMVNNHEASVVAGFKRQYFSWWLNQKKESQPTAPISEPPIEAGTNQIRSQALIKPANVMLLMMLKYFMDSRLYDVKAYWHLVHSVYATYFCFWKIAVMVYERNCRNGVWKKLP